MERTTLTCSERSVSFELLFKTMLNYFVQLKGLIADLPFSIAVANALDFALELAKDSGTRTKKVVKALMIKASKSKGQD